jgi:hypothetical protein
VKLSAYVPDWLWARARASVRQSRSSPSQVVQHALRALLERSRPRFAGAPDLEQEAALLLARQHVAEQAQGAYDHGYEAGVQRCELLSWAELERLAAGDWDWHDLGVRDGGSTFDCGLRDALRDAWLGVVLGAERDGLDI